MKYSISYSDHLYCNAMCRNHLLELWPTGQNRKDSHYCLQMQNCAETGNHWLEALVKSMEHSLFPISFTRCLWNHELFYSEKGPENEEIRRSKTFIMHESFWKIISDHIRPIYGGANFRKQHMDCVMNRIFSVTKVRCLAYRLLKPLSTKQFWTMQSKEFRVWLCNLDNLVNMYGWQYPAL